MSAEVYKDIFPESYLRQLYGHIMTECPHYFGHTSKQSEKNNESINKWYFCNLTNDIFLSRSILSFVTDKVNSNLMLGKIYANIQFAGQEGSFHYDSDRNDTKTAIIMLSETLKEGSGIFQIKKEGYENKIETHNFERNKMLYFKSKLQHKGFAPLEIGPPRVTLALKMRHV